METLISQVFTSFGNHLFPTAFILISINRFFKKRFPATEALNTLRWIIVGYAILSLSLFLNQYFFDDETFRFVNRLSEPPIILFLSLTICSSIIPLSLINRVLGQKYWFILLVSSLINVGWKLERFIIIITSFHLDHMANYEQTYSLLIKSLIILLTQSLIFSILLLVISSVIKVSNSKKPLDILD